MLGVNLILVLHAQACENIGNYIFECILNIIKFDKRRRESMISAMESTNSQLLQYLGIEIFFF